MKYLYHCSAMRQRAFGSVQMTDAMVELDSKISLNDTSIRDTMAKEMGAEPQEIILMSVTFLHEVP